MKVLVESSVVLRQVLRWISALLNFPKVFVGRIIFFIMEDYSYIIGAGYMCCLH